SHDLSERLRQGAGALLRHRPHDVALRQDADHPAIRTEHEQCADLVLGERVDGGVERGGGLDGDDVVTLGGQNSLHDHGSPPLTSSLRSLRKRGTKGRGLIPITIGFANEFHASADAMRPRWSRASWPAAHAAGSGVATSGWPR